jgi:hypothetical protein
MTKSEDIREQEQARVADIVAQTMQLKLNGAAALAVIGTFLGSIIIAISISQAKEVVQPTHEIALKNRALVEGAIEDISEGKEDRKEILKILRDMNKGVR